VLCVPAENQSSPVGDEETQDPVSSVEGEQEDATALDIPAGTCTVSALRVFALCVTALELCSLSVCSLYVFALCVRSWAG